MGEVEVVVLGLDRLIIGMVMMGLLLILQEHLNFMLLEAVLDNI